MQGLPTPDTSWVNDILQILWNTIYAVALIFYNLIPPIGNNNIGVEAGFYIVAFGGLVLFIKYYGDGIIIQIVEEGLARIKDGL